MVFSATSISFQNRYKLTDLANGVNPGDSVAMRQLTPLSQDIQTLFASLGNYVQSSQFPALFNQLRTSLNLQDKPQVEALIAAALAGIPEPEGRIASVAVYTVYQGTLATAAAAMANLGLTPSDSGNIDDANASCILLDSPTPGESGLYQLRTNGQFQSLNGELFTGNAGYYTRFYVIYSGNEPGREFAITAYDAQAQALEVQEIPYTDEYTGLGPIEVNNLNRTVNLKFNASDFVMVANDGFSLHPALKAAIALIPGLETSIDSISDLLDDLNQSLSAQIQTLTATVAQLGQTVQAQANSISGLRTDVDSVLARVLAAFSNVQAIFFAAGVPQVKVGNSWVSAPAQLVQELAGDADSGIYRISHGRGVLTVPRYFEANAAGEPKRACFLFETQDITADYVEMRVEKYKPVIVIFEAGLRASAFA